VEDSTAAPAPIVAPHPEGYDAVVVLDFGGQTSQLITRRVREAGVYCELLPWDAPIEQVMALHPQAFILSGGPASVYEPDAPTLPSYVLDSGLPVLGICYGLQLLAHDLGGQVVAAAQREYGPATIHLNPAGIAAPLFAGLPADLAVWMSHGDRIEALPPGFAPLAVTTNAPFAAASNTGDGGSGIRDQDAATPHSNQPLTPNPRPSIYGIQFHPEVVHTPQGTEILRNFLFRVAGLRATWSAESFIDQAVATIRERVGPARVLCGLSGGVDSAVVAALLHRAIGDQLTCIFVDTGLLRAGEAEQVLDTFGRHMQVDLRMVDASDRFLARLEGIEDPEEKRRRIGTEFIRVFEAAAAEIGTFTYLAQGTLYPDVVESAGPERRTAARIKTHHNVGGLPADMRFQLVEPLRYLFKDEARAVGTELGLPPEIVWRHPFPGPGLAVRILGPVTRAGLETLRAADAIMREELWQAGLERDIWQALAVLTPLRSVGVQGDGRTYGNLIALRAVTSTDGMTADWARIPDTVLARISNRIVNEVPGINRVVYDITSKPPATIEWE
jgi:GMP synthase (glutamine-hydrolysing)